MDINSYSYTPYMLPDEEERVYAKYEDDNGYSKLTLEQWGSDPNRKVWNIYSFDYAGKKEEVSEVVPCDCTHGWESMRLTYEKAARLYNSCVPDNEVIPLF